jgi:hypothetical protein
MKPDTRRYLLGSIVSVYASKMAVITSMTETAVGVKYSDESIETVPWHAIRPISLDPSFMSIIGFSQLKKVDLPHHYEVVMDIRINGRFYTARGICLKDRSLWSFNNVSVQFIHQIQSLIWIIEPTYTFDLK